MKGKQLSTSIHNCDQPDKSPAEPPGQGQAKDGANPAVVSLEPLQLRLETEPSGPVVVSGQTPLYKAALYAEQTKFGKPRDQYQMTLAEAQTDWTPDDWGPLGIAPTVDEDKALSAIQILLDRTGYKGNLPPDRIVSAAFRWEGNLPNLAFTWPEYLEAYGLRRDAKGQFPRHQEDRAKAALLSLTRPRRILYTRTRYVGGQRRHDVIACEKPLVELIEGYQDLTNQELAEVRAGRRPERASRLILQPSPLLLDSLETFHLYKPANLHQQIEDLVARKKGKRTRPIRSHSLFIQFLHTIDLAEFRVSRERLVDTLRLSKYRDQRKLSQAYQQIDECLAIAQELGFILSHQEDALGVITMRLNPEKLSRVRARLDRTAAQQERLQASQKQTA